LCIIIDHAMKTYWKVKIKLTHSYPRHQMVINDHLEAQAVLFTKKSLRLYLLDRIKLLTFCSRNILHLQGHPVIEAFVNVCLML
jgi:hypothetical protein